MGIASPMWFSPPSPVPLTLDQDGSCELGMSTFDSGFSYPMNSMIPQLENVYPIPPYPTPYLDAMGTPMMPELDANISMEDSSRGFSSERGEDAIEAEIAQTRRNQSRGSQRKPRAKKSTSQGTRTRETSHDSTDSVSEKTPAQKMRRLVQNRVSQRNFRKRQANERLRLEEQVKMLSNELHNLNDRYQDLLERYEGAQRERSESSGEAMNSWMNDTSTMSQFNIAGLE